MPFDIYFFLFVYSNAMKVIYVAFNDLMTVLHILFYGTFYYFFILIFYHFFHTYVYLCIFFCVCVTYNCSDLIYISLLVIFCIIEYVMNLENLEP